MEANAPVVADTPTELRTTERPHIVVSASKAVPKVALAMYHVVIDRLHE